MSSTAFESRRAMSDMLSSNRAMRRKKTAQDVPGTIFSGGVAIWFPPFSSMGPQGHVDRFGHTRGHTTSDANVCLVGTRRATLVVVKYFAWDDAKNAKLKADRGIGLEDVVFHIERGGLLDILKHPNPDRYAGQRIFVVQREHYVYLLPFVEDEHSVFLKTIIPSRKATKQYLGEESYHED